jgi:hypothetical protein
MSIRRRGLRVGLDDGAVAAGDEAPVCGVPGALIIHQTSFRAGPAIVSLHAVQPPAPHSASSSIIV